MDTKQKKWEDYTPEEKKQVKKGLIIIIAIALFVIFVGPSMCSSDDSKSNDETAKVESFEVGQYAYFTDNCIGVVNKDDWDEIMDFVKANDNTGIMSYVAAGKAVTFAAGKQVKIIKVGFEFVRVRDVDGTEALVWVPTNMLTHEDVYGVSSKQK